MFSSDRSSPSIISPWLMLPPSFTGCDLVYKFYSLAEKKVFSINKSGAGGEESDWDSIPEDGAEILPPIHDLPNPEINLRDGCGSVSKVIISGSPAEDDCVAMMSFGPGRRLALCWPRLGKEWTPIGDLFHWAEEPDLKFGRVYEDFAYSTTRKLFTCATPYGLEDWACSPSPTIVWAENEHLEPEYRDSDVWSEEYLELLESGSCRHMKYIVFSEQFDQHFLVMRHVMYQGGSNVTEKSSRIYKTFGFDIYKIDREGGKLWHMDRSLDGLAIFVGNNHSFAMCASEFPELKPDSIYFTDAKELTPTHDVGIFDYKNKTISPCSYPSNNVPGITRIAPAPIWFTPISH
ncbi:hypothetical protein C2S52_012288 [Perilla frutescens var. hirtella]|nr:hypothetical protein C2S52_012288 [Perilla frutescens var. hirtella]